MNDGSQVSLFTDMEQTAKKIRYVPPDDAKINKFSSLVSQEFYGSFDVPFVRGFSMLIRAIGSIKAKEMNEE